MPVGTAAAVKALTPDDLENLGAQIILANNYHLYLRPGPANVKKLGGIHKFMNWPHPILSDSGGFQVQSLHPKITDEGVEFKSHLDGSFHFLTPESATLSQIQIGADIIMAFDHSLPKGVFKKYAREATNRTHNWLVRCKKTWLDADPNKKQALFGIIQGGEYPDLRRESAKFVVDQDLPGIAIGGAVIGSDPNKTAEAIASIANLLPKDKPLYTMGVGVRPSDLIAAVKAGADMFDCVAPTRLARAGLLYHPEPKSERIDISKSIFKLDKKPIFDNCDCYTCRNFTRAYLHHLFRCHELLYFRLASIHNLRTMIRTVQHLTSAPVANTSYLPRSNQVH